MQQATINQSPTQSKTTRPFLKLYRAAFSRLWQNKLGTAGGVFLLLLIIAAIFAPYIAPFDPSKQDYSAVLQGPSAKHWLGTDDLGRDCLSRIIYGARVSLKAGIISVGIALIIGVPIGLLSGYLKGLWDELIIMRITDAMLSFPPLVLALTLAAVLGAGLSNAMLAIGLVFTPNFIRLVRGQVLSQREREYVEATRSSGISHFRIIVHHILPNSLAPILVQATLSVASAILSEASLSYLGLGTQPPTPSWGAMLSEAQGYLEQDPLLAVWPGLFIFLIVISINFFGDAVRDMLDPKLK